MKTKSVLAGVAMAVVMGNANASFTCTGVPSTALNASGTLWINYGYGVHAICNVNERVNGISPQHCRALHTEFLQAKIRGKGVTLYFRDTGDTCGTLGNWVTPNPFPYYFKFGR